MKIRSFLFFIFGILCLSLTNSAWTSSSDAFKEKMIQNLDFIKNDFNIRYAPADWKKQFFGWDLDYEIELAKDQIQKNPIIKVKDYQRILKHLFNSPRDFHVSVDFYSTEFAMLPFRVEGVNNRYFVTRTLEVMDPDLPLQMGDEIISFDNQPVQEVIKEFQNDNASSTDKRFAESYLTIRLGSQGHFVPQGRVIIAVKHRNGKKATYTPEWFYYPEDIQNHEINRTSKGISSLNEKQLLGQHPFYHKQRILPFYKNIKDAQKRLVAHFQQNTEDPFNGALLLGGKKSFVPNLGKVTWTAPLDWLFHAYVFKTPSGKVVGYIRIPDYHSEIEMEAYAEVFQTTLGYFQMMSTEALVLDQLNNPGGSSFYMYAIASMLTDKPLFNLKEQMTLTQEDIYFALSTLEELQGIKNNYEAVEAFGETIDGFIVNYQLVSSLRMYNQFLIDQWNKGRELSEPEYIYGMDYIQPNPYLNYSKPILMLVNNLSISCGDLLPAIFQDNKRATIFGSKTAGAGGFITISKCNNHFGIENYSLTGSIAQRKDGRSLENLGVVPDILYEITERDLQEGYPDYVKAVQKALDDMLKK